MSELLPPLKPLPIKERLSVVFIERGEIDVLDGAFVVVDVTGIRTQIPVGGLAGLMLEPGARISHAAVALAGALLALPLAAAEPGWGLGEELPASRQVTLNQTVYPDGRNLPPGRGSVAEGRALYAQRCAGCHGESGSEGPASRLAGSDGFFSLADPLRPLRIRQFPRHVQSVGAMWPYATSIFDYIRRAMPPQAPKSLDDAQTYALTAYVLHLNGLLAAHDTLDRTSLLHVRMPGLRRGVSAWRQGCGR